MENENILLISYGILHGSQGGGFLTLIWLVIGMRMLARNYEGSIKIHDVFLITHYLEHLG